MNNIDNMDNMDNMDNRITNIEEKLNEINDKLDKLNKKSVNIDYSINDVLFFVCCIYMDNFNYGIVLMCGLSFIKYLIKK